MNQLVGRINAMGGSANPQLAGEPEVSITAGKGFWQMRKFSFRFAVLAVVFLGVIAPATVARQTKEPQLEITLKRNDAREQNTKQQLLRLLATYDFSFWIFTRTLVIDGSFDVIPHSHPVLTLSTRHLKDDELLLATFVHEQLHWYVAAKPKETESAYQELKTLFPNAPVGFPRGGNSEEWTYKHILVCFLEYQAVKDLLGEFKAKQVMEFCASDHYTWIYRTVIDRGRDISALMRKHKLIPIRPRS